MILGLVVVLVLIAAIALAAWWFFDFDMPEVTIPAAAPGIGAAALYWYGGPLAWATVVLLAAIAAFCLYRIFAARREDAAPK